MNAARVSTNDALDDVFDRAADGIARTMARVLVDLGLFDGLSDVSVRFDLRALDRAQLAETIAQWVWAEVKQGREGLS